MTLALYLQLLIGLVSINPCTQNGDPTLEETVRFIESHGNRITTNNLRFERDYKHVVKFSIEDDILHVADAYYYYNDEIGTSIDHYFFSIAALKDAGYTNELNTFGLFFSEHGTVKREQIRNGKTSWVEMDPTTLWKFYCSEDADEEELVKLEKALLHLSELIQEKEVNPNLFD